MKSVRSVLSPLRGERALIMLCFGLYALSLCLPAYRPIIGYAKSDVYYGWAALLLGPIGLFGGHFSWLANPLIWYSWSQYERGRFARAAQVAILGLAVALTFIFTKHIPEGSSGSYPYQIRIGYYVWLTSMVTFILAAVLAHRARGKQEPKHAV